MAVNAPPDRHRPYAAPANIIAVLRRVRARNVPERLDNEFLRVARISDNVFGRVNDALRFLGLVEPDGRASDLLQAIGGATEQEYRQLLEGALREAYRDDFARVNPSEDTQAQIVDQFAPYQPRSQTSRMVMLFLGLCREAGIPVAEGAPRERPMRTATSRVRTATARGRTSTSAPAARGARGQSTPPPSAGGGLAGLTEADLMKLDQATFQEVWAVLGKALYVARTAAQTQPPEGDGADEDEETENG